ncbi:uncharacterized protein BJ212DRAFT_1389995 [Suillus subaureus]|uniref:Fungal-type protein kinase domain-containing protein n=1 Tax=Suillus subaureus TaxID=48587 RepID=A0A9P7DXU6_9AGAM|nr:uncharacterized protein BJ212DRAFT_1389995 [Suillus subaureus]KAG1805929.1 hypothetical protein BJ212DRAFT_1389995 [Suillus subaureus]
MALDLLSTDAQQGEVEHLYRHDLESFMWVFAWVVLRYRQGVLLLWKSRLFISRPWSSTTPVRCYL